MQQKIKIFQGVLFGTALAMSAAAFAYKPPPEVPALMSHLAAVRPLIGAAMAGKRIVAVGLRGHIVYSDDSGKTWVQASVPVSSDLVAVSFPDDKNGWAVGHYGIVLHTADGGATWEKQLDGKSAAELTDKYYAAKTGADLTPEAERAARQAKLVVEAENTQTLLDVAFVNNHEGYVVGTFNRIFRTEDGGKTWTPLMDRSDNARELHFYSVLSAGQEVYLTGEQGMVWRFDKTKNSFTSIQTPYNGTLFGIIVNGDNLLAYGMRGSLFRSGDQGKSWEKVHLDSQAGISGGVLLPDGQIAIANQAGGVMLSSDQGKTFHSAKLANPMSYFGLVPIAGNNVALVGSEGVRVESLQ